MTGSRPGDTLADDLIRLGLESGADVLVHTSLRAIGVGPPALLDALRRVLGAGGTVVVPTHTANNSTTSRTWRAAVDGMGPAEAAAYVRAMPGFDPAVTPSFGVGAFAEYVRTRPAARRSAHPQTSFAAIGPAAYAITEVHDLDSHLGERSPLGRLYARAASVLLAGVGYEACSAFHLAEYRMRPPPRHRPHRCFVIDNGQRKTLDFQALHLDDTDFAALGADVDRQPFVRSGMIGNASTRAFPMRPAVDFAVGWLSEHRID